MNFKNKKTGQYKSVLEKTVRKAMPRKKGLRIRYESKKIPYHIPGNYLPDFVIELPSGRVLYIEVKGWFRQEDKRKMKAVKLCNPDLDIRFVFPSKNSRSIAWCEKYGFPWAVGNAPKEWFE